MTTSWKRTDHRSMDGHDPKCATFRALGDAAFSWRLNERIFVCPVPKNDSVRWNCIPPRRGQRPRWYGPGGRAPGLSDQAVTGTLAGKGFPVCWPYGQTGGGCFLGGSFAAIRWRHHLQVLAHPVYAMRYREERPLPSCISLPSSSIFLSSRYALI